MRGHVRTASHGGHHEPYSPVPNAMCKRWDTPIITAHEPPSVVTIGLPTTTANLPRQKPTAGCPPWRRDRRHLGISEQRTVERFAVVLRKTIFNRTLFGDAQMTPIPSPGGTSCSRLLARKV